MATSTSSIVRAEITSYNGHFGFIRLLDGSGRTASIHHSKQKGYAEPHPKAQVTTVVTKKGKRGWSASFWQVSRNH